MAPVTRHSGVVALNSTDPAKHVAPPSFDAQDGAAYAGLMSLGGAGGQANYTPPQSDSELNYQPDGSKVEASGVVTGDFADGIVQATDSLGPQGTGTSSTGIRPYGQRQIANTLSGAISATAAGSSSWYQSDAHEGSAHSSNHASGSHDMMSVDQDDDVIEDEDDDYDPESNEDDDGIFSALAFMPTSLAHRY